MFRRGLGRLGLATLVLAGACSASNARITPGPRTASFRVLYRVVHSESSASPTTQWELLTIKRPFLGSDLTFRTRPNLHALPTPQSGNLTDVDHLYDVDGKRLRNVAGRNPSLPTGDQALLDGAKDATGRKLARRKGTKTVAGIKCQVLEYADQPVGELSALTDDLTTHDDLCVSAGGVVLREVYTFSDRVILSREAVSVTAAPADAFDTSNAEALPDNVPAPTVAPLEPGTAAPPTPNGYTLATAVAFAVPRTDDPTQDAYASAVWAFTKGAEVITVESGAGQVLPWKPEDDKALRIGKVPAASVVRSDGIDIHWLRADGRWVRVRGPMALAALLPYARLVSSWDSSPAAVPK